MENSRGEAAIYKLADLEGSIVLGGANRVVAAEHAWKGVVFGNDFPAVYDYQVENVCQTSCKTKVVWLYCCLFVILVSCNTVPPTHLL